MRSPPATCSGQGVDIGPMFGSAGLRIRGKVFAFQGYQGGTHREAAEARVTELDSGGRAQRMTMRERAMREWVFVGRMPPTSGRP